MFRKEDSRVEEGSSFGLVLLFWVTDILYEALLCLTASINRHLLGSLLIVLFAVRAAYERRRYFTEIERVLASSTVGLLLIVLGVECCVLWCARGILRRAVLSVWLKDVVFVIGWMCVTLAHLICLLLSCLWLVTYLCCIRLPNDRY